jgi:hypothetical protein
MMAKITYYDFCNLQYAGFYLNGFQENVEQRGYRFVVSHEKPSEITTINLKETYLTQYLNLHLLFRYEGDESFLFAIDTSDLNGDASLGVDFYPLLDICRYYFKVNYNKEAIEKNPVLAPYQDKILPVPIVFPVAVSQPWRFLPKVSSLNGSMWPRKAISQRFKSLRHIPSLADYRRMRAVPKDYDVFFIALIRSEVGRPYNIELNNHRKAIVEGLNKYSRYNILARYIDVDGDAKGLGSYVIPRMKLSEYLNLMSRSRIGIYVRGFFGCLSFKFGELMALGSPVVGESILNNREMMYGFNYFQDQFAYDEPEEIVERIIYLLEHPALIDEYHRANTETFENHLSPRPVVSAILDQLESRGNSFSS